MSKVVIINAPAREHVYGALSALAAVEIPVWAGLLADYLARHGHKATILDAEMEGLTVGQTAERIHEAKPALAVFPVYGQQPSASTQCLPAAERVARLVYEHGFLPAR